MSDWFNAMIGILVSPAEGCGGFVVLPDVTDQLSGEVGCRSEDSASDDISLDFGKPDLDLIKPTGIGRGVVDPHRWIGLEELENVLGFMCAQIVGDDVNLSAGSGANLKGSASGGNGLNDRTGLGAGTLQGSAFRPRNYCPVRAVVPDIQAQLP